jgi:hypothetical protein
MAADYSRPRPNRRRRASSLGPTAPPAPGFDQFDQERIDFDQEGDGEGQLEDLEGQELQQQQEEEQEEDVGRSRDSFQGFSGWGAGSMGQQQGAPAFGAAGGSGWAWGGREEETRGGFDQEGGQFDQQGYLLDQELDTPGQADKVG